MTVEAATFIFVMVVGANLGGSIGAIMETTRISTLSFQAIRDGFGNLALMDQIGLILAIIFALSVPVGNVVIGQAVAHLILDVEDRGTPLEAKWKRERYELLYNAFFSKALENKLPPERAAVVASKMAAGFAGVVRPKELPLPVQLRPMAAAAEPVEMEHSIPLPVQTAASGLLESGNGKRIGNAREAALEAYAQGKTVKQVIEERIAGKSTAYAVWAEFNEGKAV